MSGLRRGLAEAEATHQKAVDNHVSKQAELQRHSDRLLEEHAQTQKAYSESKQKLAKEREDKAATAAELAGIMDLVSDERMTSEKYAEEAREARATAAELERKVRCCSTGCQTRRGPAGCNQLVCTSLLRNTAAENSPKQVLCCVTTAQKAKVLQKWRPALLKLWMVPLVNPIQPLQGSSGWPQNKPS